MEKDFKRNKQSHNKNRSRVIYYGINVENKSSIIQALVTCLSKIHTKYESFLPYYETISSFIQSQKLQDNEINIKYPNTFHITTLFVGKNPNFKLHKAFTTFTKNKQVPINIHGLAILPYKIATLICTTTEIVDNKFPHITTLVGSFKPKQSNDIMLSLFDTNQPYEHEYTSYTTGVSNVDLIEQTTVNIENVNETIYFTLLAEPIIVEGVMTEFTH
jgi:hypothetical protein